MDALAGVAVSGTAASPMASPAVNAAMLTLSFLWNCFIFLSFVIECLMMNSWE